MARIVDFADGAESETTPTIGNIVASSLVQYPDDATYEATEQNAPSEGNIYFNTTLDLIRYYNGTEWISLVDESSTQTITNKSIDADQNTITNIEDADIKTGAAINAEKIHDGSVDNTEFGHLDGVTSNIQTQLDAKQNTSEKDQPNGYAGLDGDGRISESALPVTALIYRGVWDASTNTPTLADGVGTQGDVYRTSVAGTQDLGSGSITFEVGDWVTYNGSIWQRSDFAGAGVLNDLADVDTAGVVDGQALVYNQGAGEWQPGTIQNVVQENFAFVGNGTASWTVGSSGNTSVQQSLGDTGNINLPTTVRVGYTFTPSATGELQTIVGRLVDIGNGNGDGSVNIEVYATAAGLPTGSALDTSSGLNSSLLTGQTNTPLTNNFNFSGNVLLTAGTEYAAVYNSTDTGTLEIRRGSVDETFSQNVEETGIATDTYVAAATQETIYHDVQFNNLPGELVLSEDCFLSVPPLANDRHTIQAQSVFLDDGECAYVTVDRAAVSPTNLTVTVDQITNVTPDNDIIVFARNTGDECYLGIHDPQRISDGETADIQKGGGGFSPVNEQRETAVWEGVNAGVPNNTNQTANINTVLEDTKNGISGNAYIVQKTGTYNISGYMQYVNTSTGSRFINIYVNGIDTIRVLSTPGNPSTFTGHSFNTQLSLTQGDSVTLVLRQATGSNETINTFIRIEEAVNETNVVTNDALTVSTVRVIASNTAGGTYDATSPVSNWTEQQDTHNAFDPVTGEFTVPKTGAYQVTASLLQTSSNTALATIFVNGTRTKDGVVSGSSSKSVSSVLFLNENDVVDIRSTTGSSATLSAGAPNNHLSIYSLPDFTTYGVINPATEFVSATSSEETVPALSVWIQMTGNSVTLGPGTWRLTGSAEYYNVGGGGGFARTRALWALDNGDDTATAPTSIAAIHDAGYGTTGAYSMFEQGSISSNTGNLGSCVAQELRITTTDPSTQVFLVPRSDNGTIANQRTFTTIYAERIK